MKKLALIALLAACVLPQTLVRAQDSISPSVNTAPADSAGATEVRKDKFYISPGFGASLVRNELAPVFYISLGFIHKENYEINVNTSSLSFFEKSDGSDYNIYRNTFLNAEFLLNFSPLNTIIDNWNGIGFGYLIESKGQVFEETTFQVYYRKKLKFVSLTGGIVFDDNFANAFPTIGVRF